jgi:hypothetical protein
LQYPQRPCGDIFEVADRGCNQIKCAHIVGSIQ